MKKKSARRSLPRKKSPVAKHAPKAHASASKPIRERHNSTFPIVGIGASAGGLEALEQFLMKVPAQCGMAFVVIQHLDPTQKGMLPELLQRATTMQVMQAGNDMAVKPNKVYVIPPNKDLSILHGTLHLFEPVAPRGLRLPIDFFLRSLAEDRKELSIGIILSGMGSDGTLGLRAIKEKGGLVLVQQPTSAKFDSMPRSAIAAGLADIVAEAAELPAKIVEVLHHIPPLPRSARVAEGESHSAIEKIVSLMQARTRHDFSLYKRSTLNRRVERRMAIHKIATIAAYVRYLRENAQELDLLFKELLIGVTSFFRDRSVWTVLQEQALPQLLAAHPDGKALRAWVVGCSTGEEAYSLAIAFCEVLEQVKPRGKFTLQIFATDLQEDAIAKARLGFYPANIAADVTQERLSRFFNEEDGLYRIRKSIREMVTFAPQDVIIDPPFTKLDILSCRNLLIYFEPELQKRLIPLFHYSLNTGGILCLGSAETPGGFTEQFVPISAKARLYRRRGGTPHATALQFPTRLAAAPHNSDPSKDASATTNLQLLADHLLLQRFAPPTVLVNDQGDVLYVRGRTGKYLEPAAGKANWNIYAMAREGLRNELMAAVQKAIRQRTEVNVKGVRVRSDAGLQSVNLTAHFIEEPEALRGMVMIVFSDATLASRGKLAQPSRNARVVELEEALRQAQEESQSAREEMQTSQEELKSANEELQSTNEELQSTNEELTTSKEEMQSMNEELQMVNHELQAKVDELSWASDDMKNLLNSTDIATVFLNNALKVRRFTTQASRIFRLIPGDAGRPLSDIVTDLVYPDLQQDAQQVLRTLSFSEKEIATHDGRWFSVRIMPYRTTENAIDGVVITFTEITAAKHLEAELRARIGKEL